MRIATPLPEGHHFPTSSMILPSITQALNDDQVRHLYEFSVDPVGDAINNFIPFKVKIEVEIVFIAIGGEINGDGREDYIANELDYSYLFFARLKIDDLHNVADLAEVVIDHSTLGVPGNRFADVQPRWANGLNLHTNRRQRFIDKHWFYGASTAGLSLASRRHGRVSGTPVLSVRFSHRRGRYRRTYDRHSEIVTSISMNYRPRTSSIDTRDGQAELLSAAHRLRWLGTAWHSNGLRLFGGAF